MIPTAVQLPPRQTASPVDVRRIYENDLFKTYVPSLKPEEAEETLELNPPPAPQLQQAPRLMPPMVRFLEPLKIDLKGIITSSDPHNNKAIIADEKTKKELNYTVGDVVEDAEIVRIERNKVIFVRSNGQQEVVFLTQREANKDEMFAPKIPWHEIIHQTSDVSFTINKQLFKERVKNIVQLIEMLDLTTTRDANGMPVGCVIGILSPDSIGHSLGLRTGDVVVSVDNKPVATTTQRAQVFQTIKSYGASVVIPIQLLRNQQPITLYISVHGISDIQPSLPSAPLAVPVVPQRFEPAKPIFAPVVPPQQPQQPVERKMFAAPPPMVNQLNQMTRENMKAFGGQAAQIKRQNANER
jgi:type II secretion system protein C